MYGCLKKKIMETFVKYRNKTVAVIDNELYIILKGCKPRPIYRDGINEEAFYLKKSRLSKELERVYIGY